MKCKLNSSEIISDTGQSPENKHMENVREWGGLGGVMLKDRGVRGPLCGENI